MLKNVEFFDACGRMNKISKIMKFVLNLVSQINDCQLSHLYKHIGSFNFDVEKKQILLQNEKIIFKMHEIFPDSWETALYKTLHHYQLDVEPFPGAIGLLILVIIFVLCGSNATFNCCCCLGSKKVAGKCSQ